MPVCISENILFIVSNLDSPPAKRQKLKAKPLNTPEEARAEFGRCGATFHCKNYVINFDP